MHKILIVDDDANSRAVLQDQLEGDYELVEASDGDESLRLATAHPPDLILLDVLMPKRDGSETLRALKASDVTRHVPVIMVTALGLESQVAVTLKEGAHDHIVKPFSNTVLRASIRAALRSGTDSKSAAVSAPAAQLVAFIGSKGGVGTSTVAANYDACTAHKQKTLLVELQASGESLGTQPGIRNAEEMGVRLQDPQASWNADRLKRRVAQHSAGFAVLPAAIAGSWNAELSPELVDRMLDLLPTICELCILDLPCYPCKSIPNVLSRCN